MKKIPRKNKQWAKEAYEALEKALILFEEEYPNPTEGEKMILVSFAAPIAALNRDMKAGDKIRLANEAVLENLNADLALKDPEEPIIYSINFLLAYLDSQVSFGYISESKSDEIMYVEEKSGVASLEANIGQVFLSKTGKTLEYNGRKFQSLKGVGYKANYFDIETGEHYWISKCRKDGNDRLYKTKVFIDEEIREEYWRSIRNMSDRVSQEFYTSTGKHKANGQEIKNHRKNF